MNEDFLSAWASIAKTGDAVEIANARDAAEILIAPLLDKLTGPAGDASTYGRCVAAVSKLIVQVHALEEERTRLQQQLQLHQYTKRGGKKKKKKKTKMIKPKHLIVEEISANRARRERVETMLLLIQALPGAATATRARWYTYRFIKFKRWNHPRRFYRT